MSTAIQMWTETRRQLGGWSWLKKSLLVIAIFTFATSSFLYLTPPGLAIREFLAQTVISTQHRDWAWIFVGADKRDYMVKMSHQFTETSALEKQDLNLIKHDLVQRKARSVDELISEPIDISGQFWKGKMIYVYDPTSVRVVVPNKVGEGERISSMVKRTGAVAGINGGGFVDPDGLGNGFAPIGLILSGNEAVYADVEPTTAQHVVGFTKEGTLVVGKYSLFELQAMGVTDAVSFLAPRLIANGNPQITSGDGGWGRAPRTAVGQKEDGTLIFVVIDGRQTTSVGATLKEVQDLLLKEGAINAGMMDGGASSELVVKGDVLTKPSSRYGERRLPSGLVVMDEPETYKVDRIWDGLDKINPGGAFDHPDFLKEQAELKKQQQNQPQTPPKKTEPEKTTQEPAKQETGGEKTTPPKTDTGTGSTGSKPATTPGGTPAGNTGGTKPGTPAAGSGNGQTAPSNGAATGGTGAPNGASNGTTNGTSNGATSGATNAATNGAPNGTSGATNGATNGTSSGNTAPAAGGGSGGAPAVETGKGETAQPGTSSGGGQPATPPAAPKTDTAQPGATGAATPTTGGAASGATTSPQNAPSANSATNTVSTSSTSASGVSSTTEAATGGAAQPK